MRFAFLNNRDIQIIRYINKHYCELCEEMKLIPSFEVFQEGGPMVKAVKMDILQIGENVNHLSNEAASQINTKDLRGMADVRNYIAHGYIVIDDEIVWDVIQDKLPKLIDTINNIK